MMAAAATVKMSESGSMSSSTNYPGYPGPISGMSRQVHALAPVQHAPVHGAMSAAMTAGYPFSSYHTMFSPGLAHHDPSSLFFSDISSGAGYHGYQHNMYGSYMNGVGSPFFRYKDMNRYKEMTCEWVDRDTGKICRKVRKSFLVKI